MNKVTFDTNILISSTLWKNSISRRLLDRLILQYTDIFTTEEILEEYSNVLKRDFNFSKEEIEEKLEIILSFATIINTQIKINIIKDDPDDNKILECAIASDSEFILSYDKHLLSIKEFRGIKIITPEEFLKILENSP